MSLAEKHCLPCKGGVPPLDGGETERLLKELSGWRIDEGKLTREIKFKNFKEPVAMANLIAELADREGHHPDLHIYWGRLKIVLYTHKINGLTESDFILAAKIDRLL